MNGNSTTRTHDLEKSLATSFELETADFWREVYTSLFPDMVAFIRHSGDGDHQRLGIDTTVIMANAKVYTVDEKIRHEDYGDIALEEWGDWGHRLPGWACKPLLCDYILYVILPAGKAYLLPVLQLQNAWRRHSQEWKETRTPILAPNRDQTGRTWESVSWGILPEELFPAIGGQLRTTFRPVEDQS